MIEHEPFTDKGKKRRKEAAKPYVSPSALALAARLYRIWEVRTHGSSLSGEPINIEDAKVLRFVKKEAGAWGPPVEFIPGNESPRFKGTNQHYVTSTGQHINYPDAYRKKGKSNMYCVPGTSRVCVGIDWVGCINGEAWLLWVRLAASRRWGLA